MPSFMKPCDIELEIQISRIHKKIIQNEFDSKEWTVHESYDMPTLQYDITK